MHFEAFRADLKAVHTRNRLHRGQLVIEAHKSEALAQLRVPIDEHFARQYVTERTEGRVETQIAELLRKMINKKIAVLRTLHERSDLFAEQTARLAADRRRLTVRCLWL